MTERGTPMTSRRRACRLSIYFGNADTYRHKALSGEILNRAHRAGLAGVTTLQGIHGYGRRGSVHSTPRWGVTDRTPIGLYVIDDPAAIRGFLAQLHDLADQCLIICEAVEVLATDEGRPPAD
jgi:uncharacterized protein